MWNLFGAPRKATLQSPLSLEICRERLRGETGSRWNPFSRWTHPVRGSVNENGFRIVKAIGYNNSMQTEAAGTWASDGNGTRIEVTLGLERTTRWGLALWLIFMAIFGAIWLVLSPIHETHELPALRVAPLIAVAAAAVGMWFGRWLARGDDDWLVDFLRRTLECPPASEPLS